MIRHRPRPPCSSTRSMLAICAAHHILRAPVRDQRLQQMIDIERPVRVVRNWKRHCYTILQDGVPRASASGVRLAVVEFRVRESGRLRMLREGKRNVHAYAVGHLVDFVHPGQPRRLPTLDGRAAAYDPWRFDSFVDCQTLAPIGCAALAQFDDDGLRYTDIARHPATDLRVLPAAA